VRNLVNAPNISKPTHEPRDQPVPPASVLSAYLHTFAPNFQPARATRLGLIQDLSLRWNGGDSRAVNFVLQKGRRRLRAYRAPTVRIFRRAGAVATATRRLISAVAKATTAVARALRPTIIFGRAGTAATGARR